MIRKLKPANIISQSFRHQTSSAIIANLPKELPNTKTASQLFSEEKERQKLNVARIDKIEVEIVGLAKSETTTSLMMNKLISTPTDCAMR